MFIPFVDLKAQYESMKFDIDAAISDVIADTAFIGGKYVKVFEEQFANYLGLRYCIGCGNGTDALEILLTALGIGEGDDVIVPANTFIATSEAVTKAGAKPVFVDCHPFFYTIDVSKIEEKITTKTKAIIPVHLYGLPAEMDQINEIAKKYELKVIEDAAQAHGAEYKGKKVGTLADAAMFSFYPGKNLGAYGDAGAMVTDSEVIATKVRMIANHGRMSKYDHEFEGRNSRMDGLQAAILSAKLPHLGKWTEARRHNAKLYTGYLSASSLQLPVAPDYSRHVYPLYVVQAENRDRLQAKLKQEGIATGIHYPIALPILKAYRYMGHKSGDFPVASKQMHNLISLPMFPELSGKQIKRVTETIISCLKKHDDAPLITK